MIKIKDKTIRIGFQLSLLFLIVQLAILVFFWDKLPPQVPLLYSRPWGEEQLISPVGLFIPPIISFLIIIVNSIAATLIPGEEKLASQLLVLFAAVFSFLCFITIFKIVTLIT